MGPFDKKEYCMKGITNRILYKGVIPDPYNSFSGLNRVKTIMISRVNNLTRVVSP